MGALRLLALSTVPLRNGGLCDLRSLSGVFYVIINISNVIRRGCQKQSLLWIFGFSAKLVGARPIQA
jgi:hypothetical protein